MIPAINLASTNHPAVIADVRKLYPQWDEQNITLQLDENYQPYPFSEDEEGNAVQIQTGYRVDIRKIPDRVLEDAEFDDDGNLTKDAVLAGEYRVDIIPSEPVKLPEFGTQVFPEIPDMEYQ